MWGPQVQSSKEEVGGRLGKNFVSVPASRGDYGRFSRGKSFIRTAQLTGEAGKGRGFPGRESL